MGSEHRRDAKVTQLDHTAAHQENVLCLEIAMQNFLLVKMRFDIKNLALSTPILASLTCLELKRLMEVLQMFLNLESGTGVNISYHGLAATAP